MSLEEKIEMLWDYYERDKVEPGRIIEWTKEALKEAKAKKRADLEDQCKRLLQNLGVYLSAPASSFISRLAAERKKRLADPFLAELTRLADAGIKEVCTVGVLAEDCILTGKRTDNGRWTFPGGHKDPGETIEQGAKRELAEEAGIEADEFHHLGSDEVTTFSGKQILVHSFRTGFAAKVPTDSSRDPDNEVKEWIWAPISYGLADEIMGNLHSPKNNLLKRLGLQQF